MNTTLPAWNETSNAVPASQGGFYTLSVVLFSLDFVIGFLSVLLNLFVIQTIISKEGLVGSAECFVFGMAVSDWMTGLGLMLTIVNAIWWRVSWTFCLLQICLLQSTLLCSSLYMAALTVSRYVKIMYPYEYNLTWADWQPWGLCVSLWVVSWLVGFSPMFAHRPSSRENFLYCSYLQVIEGGLQAIIFLMMVSPVLVSVALYYKILGVAMNHAVQISHLHNAGLPGDAHIRRRYLRMIFLMSALYLMIYVPAAVGSAVSRNARFIMDETTRRSLFHLCCMGVLTSSILNPVLYSFKASAVKARLQGMFGLHTPPSTPSGLTLATDISRRRSSSSRTAFRSMGPVHDVCHVVDKKGAERGERSRVCLRVCPWRSPRVATTSAAVPQPPFTATDKSPGGAGVTCDPDIHCKGSTSGGSEKKCVDGVSGWSRGDRKSLGEVSVVSAGSHRDQSTLGKALTGSKISPVLPAAPLRRHLSPHPANPAEHEEIAVSSIVRKSSIKHSSTDVVSPHEARKSVVLIDPINKGDDVHSNRCEDDIDDDVGKRD